MKYTAAGILCFCISASFIFAQQPALIMDAGILGDYEIKASSPPPRFIMGIETAEACYFKLVKDNSIIAAGQFHKGFNTLTVESRRFFAGPGDYFYRLECKRGVTISEYEFIFQVDMESGQREQLPDGSGPGRTGPPRYRKLQLDVYVDGRLIASRSRGIQEKLQLSLDLPPLPKNYDPFNPNMREDPLANSVSILDAVGLAAHYAGKIIKKTKPVSSPGWDPTKLRKQVRVIFSTRTAAGVSKEIRADVNFRLKKIQ